jgi:dUTP pyrophosphatase
MTNKTSRENMVELKVKKLHKDAIMPRYQSDGAACVDLHAIFEPIGPNVFVDSVMLLPNESRIIRTGLAFEVPRGYVMLIFSRSGHGFKNDVRLSNCVGVIDSDYRGEVQIKLSNDGGDHFTINNDDRIAQAMLVKLPWVELIEVDELSETARGTNGFGSTGS